MLGCINRVPIKHLEKREVVDVTYATVASGMCCSVCKERKSEALSYGRGCWSPKTSGEAVHTVLGVPFRAGVIDMKYFQCSWTRQFGTNMR